MRMSKKVSRAVVVPTIALSALALGSAAAFAASSYNVTAGSAPAGTVVRYTANTTGPSPQVTFTDTTANVVLNCVSASATGEVTVGTIPGATPPGTPTPIGTVDGTTWNTCTGPFGIQLTVTGSGSWKLNATGDTVGGVTPGSVSAVNAHVAGSCAFDVTGSVDGSYTNGTTDGTLTVPGLLTLPGTSTALTISNVSGFLCGSAGIQNGDHAKFKATYQVVADIGAYNPIRITSNP